MSGILGDLRLAGRSLRASRGFTAVAALTLALAIGANATIFSWIRATLLDPIPGATSTAELVALQRGERSSSPVPPLSYLDYRDLRERTRSFSGMLGYHDDVVTLTGGSRPERLWGAIVSVNYFDVLGTRPALGRFFLPEEEGSEGGAPAVVLNHDVWRNRFGSDPGVLGRTLEVNRRPYTVVGVAPPGFRGAKTGLRSDLFIPVTMKRQVWGGSGLDDRGNAYLNVLARLRPGVEARQAERETDGLMQQIAAQFPDSHRGPNRITLDPLWRSPFGANVYLYTTLPMLLALAGVVLLLACANVANLQLVRFVARRREVALRLAMGASRWRLVRQMLVESVLVALAGGVAAVPFALWGSGTFAKFFPPTSIPLVLDGRVDVAVLLVTLALAMLSGVVFGTLPALRASSMAPFAVLKEEANRSSGGRYKGRLSSALVVAQLTLSVVLLVAAGLFIRSLQKTRDASPGFDADGVLLASFETSPATGFSRKDALTFQAAVLEGVETLPGVVSASLADWVPMTFSTMTANVEPEGYLPREHEEMEIRTAFVGPRYFETMRTSLVGGRDFTKLDGVEPVAIVNRAFAERYWPSADPVGRQVRVFGEESRRRVVGFAPNTAYLRVGEPPQPVVYLPTLDRWRWQVVLHVRVRGDLQTIAPRVVEAVHVLNPDLPVFNVTTLRSSVAFATVFERIAATFVGAFGAVALLLATVGIYGVIAYSTRQRTQEIAIRMALGAGREDVLRLVMSGGARLTAAGVLLGLGGSLAVTRLLEVHLYGVKGLDPLTFVGVVVLLSAVAFAATFLPARRATRVQPSQALREG
jgi:predicted permease